MDGEGGGVAIQTECHELRAFYRQQTVWSVPLVLADGRRNLKLHCLPGYLLSYLGL